MDWATTVTTTGGVAAALIGTAVAVNMQQLRATRFDGAKILGEVDPEAMARVDQALRAVLDLYTRAWHLGGCRCGAGSQKYWPVSFRRSARTL